jgi:hypothetical protein
MVALRQEIVFEFHWISTHDNIFADALSRTSGERTFRQLVFRDQPLLAGCKLERHASSGHVRCFGKEYSSDYTGDGPSTVDRLLRRNRPVYGSAIDRGEVELCQSLVPNAGMGLRTTVAQRAGTPIVRLWQPGWFRAADAARRAADMMLPEDSVIEHGGRACMDLCWVSPWLTPEWYYMNHAHPSRANVRLSVANPDEPAATHQLYWFATRDIAAGEELRYNYGVVPEEWNAEQIGLGTPSFLEFSSGNVLTGKRPRLRPGAMRVGKRRRPRSGGALGHGRAFSSDEDGDGPSTRGRSSTALSVTYARASIFVGLPLQSLATRADEILDNRLSASSHASMQAALGHWRVVCSRHRWPEVIASDDPSRGGKLATFMIYCVDETELAGTSILNYTWALRSYMKFCRQLDPVLGIQEWDDWAQSVQVTAWVQSEPRRMVPIDLVRSALMHVERNYAASFVSVQAVVIMLLLLFTFARSETPCPESLGGFDANQHLQVCDVIPVGDPWRLRVRLKRIKQDQRIERPEARGEGDWVVIGDTPDDAVFSIRVWLRRLFALHGGARGQAQPFFVSPSNPAQPLTYQAAMRHVRSLWAAVSDAEEAKRYGLHSLRVTGYTLARRSAGEALAVAQGGWNSDVHQRYERFSIQQVVALPGAMLRVSSTEEEQVAARAAVVPVAPAAPAQAAESAPPQVPARALPESPFSPSRKRGRSPAQSQALVTPAVVPRAPTQLTHANCIGRHVLCPKEMWPSWRCTEHGGEGWEAVIDKLSQDHQTVYVRFVAPSSRTRQWRPMWLQLAALRPI